MIVSEGCRDALVTWNGVLIDGHNRYEICHNHGIPFRVEEKEFESRDDVIEWIYQNQLSRRNLTDEKRTYLIGKQYEHRKNCHGGDRRSSSQNDHLKTSEQIAEENNTSPKSVQRAETYAKAVDTLSDIHGEEVKEKILSGEIRAYKQDVVKLADCEPEKQAAILQKVKSGESKDIKSALNECALQEAKETAISVSESDSVDISIHHGDCVEWLSSLDRCADLLITDPPYATDVENIETFAQSWLPIALSKVKPSGRAYVCIGAYPGELKAYLNVDPGELELCQVLVWTYRNTLGPSPNDQYKQNWQAILYYKGLEAPQLNCPIMTEQFSVQDINAPDNRHGKYERWHAWQKPDALAERLIRHSTEEGDLVIDPFAGTGTFLIAAKKLNRDAIGCDKSQDMIQIAYSRGGVLNNEL